MTSLVDVSQADIDAAGMWLHTYKPNANRREHQLLAEAFARHRLTAEQANAAEIERLREDKRINTKVERDLIGERDAALAEIAELTALLREARAWVLDENEDRTWDAEKAFIARIDTILNREMDNATG